MMVSVRLSIFLPSWPVCRLKWHQLYPMTKLIDSIVVQTNESVAVSERRSEFGVEV
jgi:hypothetical protein